MELAVGVAAAVSLYTRLRLRKLRRSIATTHGAVLPFHPLEVTGCPKSIRWIKYTALAEAEKEAANHLANHTNKRLPASLGGKRTGLSTMGMQHWLEYDEENFKREVVSAFFATEGHSDHLFRA